MSARSRRKKYQNKVRAPRRDVPLTETQRAREHLLIDLGVTKAEIARAIDESPSNVSAVFLDKFRSMGPDGIETRIVEYLQGRATEDFPVTLDSMGWPLVAAGNETAASG